MYHTLVTWPTTRPHIFPVSFLCLSNLSKILCNRPLENYFNCGCGSTTMVRPARCEVTWTLCFLSVCECEWERERERERDGWSFWRYHVEVWLLTVMVLSTFNILHCVHLVGLTNMLNALPTWNSNFFCRIATFKAHDMCKMLFVCATWPPKKNQNTTGARILLISYQCLCSH